MALTAHEDNLCGGCGQPKDVAWNDHDGAFIRDSLSCAGCAALHPGEDEKPAPGEKRYVLHELPPPG